VPIPPASYTLAHTAGAGSVGASTSITATQLIESGVYDTVLTVGYEKQSGGNVAWALGGGKSRSQGAGGSFAPWIRNYIAGSKAPGHIGWQVALKDRLDALNNPKAHLYLPDISIEKMRESPLLWDPLHFLESCPSSDGAAAMGITNKKGVAKAPKPTCPSAGMSPCGSRGTWLPSATRAGR
jgi:acetyl-CoA C-acetyltransferase